MNFFIDLLKLQVTKFSYQKLWI